MSGRSELAYDENGKRFAVPGNVAGWRVRRFNKPGQRGGCEIVYGDDSTPLILDVEADTTEFREAVHVVPGRYRLDAVDDEQNVFKDVPPAYLVISEAKSSASLGGPPPTASSLEWALVEAVRANASAVATMAEQMSSVTAASAAVLHAADASGMTKRVPPPPPAVVEQDDEEDDDEDDEQDGAARQGSEVVTVINQLLMAFQQFQRMQTGSGNSSTATEAERTIIVETEPAAPQGGYEEPERRRASSARGTPARGTPTSGASGPAPAPDPGQHFKDIQAQLTPDEQAFLHRAITKLSIAQLMHWRDQLAQLSVTDAVALLRSEMESAKSRDEEAKS